MNRCYRHKLKKKKKMGVHIHAPRAQLDKGCQCACTKETIAPTLGENSALYKLGRDGCSLSWCSGENGPSRSERHFLKMRRPHFVF